VLVAPEIDVKVLDPGGADSHCTDGVGVPVAAVVKVAVVPAETLWSEGLVVTTGAEFTARVAGDVVTEPSVLVNTASNWVPFSEALVAGVAYVAEVAPLIGVKVLEPDGADSHCTVAEGVARTTAVKEAVAGAETDTLAGCVFTTGTKGNTSEMS